MKAARRQTLPIRGGAELPDTGDAQDDDVQPEDEHDDEPDPGPPA